MKTLLCYDFSNLKKCHIKVKRSPACSIKFFQFSSQTKAVWLWSVVYWMPHNHRCRRSREGGTVVSLHSCKSVISQHICFNSVLLFLSNFCFDMILFSEVLVLSFAGGICEKNPGVFEPVVSSISLREEAWHLLQWWENLRPVQVPYVLRVPHLSFWLSHVL